MYISYTSILDKFKEKSKNNHRIHEKILEIKKKEHWVGRRETPYFKRTEKIFAQKYYSGLRIKLSILYNASDSPYIY